METIHTPEIWIILILIPLTFYILMIIKKPRIKEFEEQQEDIYSQAELNQLIESEQNCFM